MIFEMFSGSFRRLHRRIGDTGCVALASALVWMVRLATRSGLGFGPPRWSTWFDQGRYFASATAFLHGNLSPAEHLYPLVYPLLATPFLLLYPRDPFLLPDMILFALTIVAVVRFAARLGIGAVPATVFALLACLAQGSVAGAWVYPWTTTLAAALIWWLIDRTLAIVLPLETQPAPTPRAYLLIGLLAAALPLTRPADTIASAIILLIIGIGLIVRRRLTPGAILAVLAGGLAIAIPYLLLHLAIYGPRTTDYMNGSADAGFVVVDLPWKAYTLFVSARPWYPDTRSMIDAMPWLLPAAGGTLLTLLRPGPGRAPLLVLLAVAIPYALFYCTFADLLPPGVWEFGNLHYFKWEFPLGGLMLWVWLRSFATRRGAAAAIAALLVAILPTTIRALPKPIAADRPARMLLFHGGATRSWNKEYFAPVWVIDPAGYRMHNIGMFHQVPDANGERAIAIQRLFVPGSIRNDPGESPAYPQPQLPYARYGVALSVGMPCWLHHSACRMPPPR